MALPQLLQSKGNSLDGKQILPLPSPASSETPPSINIGGIDVWAEVELSAVAAQKLDKQSGTGANKGSVLFQGRELGTCDLKLTIGIAFYAANKSLAEQEVLVLKAIGLFFPPAKEFKGVAVHHPILAALGMRDFCCEKMSVDEDKTAGTKTFNLSLVEYFPRKKPALATTAPAENPEVAAAQQGLADAISGIPSP